MLAGWINIMRRLFRLRRRGPALPSARQQDIPVSYIGVFLAEGTTLPRGVFGSILWNLHSKGWNMRSVLWNLHSGPWNIKYIGKGKVIPARRKFSCLLFVPVRP